MPDASPPSRPRELRGWKEIASYLDVSTRTAQSWEKRHGLPVRRLGGDSGPVYISVDALHEWRARQSSTQTETPPTEGATESRDRRRWIAVVAVAAVILVSAIVLWRATRVWELPPPPHRVKLNTLPKFTPFGVYLSPDGKKGLHVSSMVGASPAQVAVVDLVAGTERLIDVPSQQDAFAWSPDGKSIAFVRGRSEICLVPSSGGPPTQIADLPGEFPSGLDWSEDGKALVAAVIGHGLYEVNVEDGAVRLLLDHPHVESPSYIPYGGGRGVLFAEQVEREGMTSSSHLTPHRLAVLSMESGAIDEVLTVSYGRPRPRYHPSGFVLYSSGASTRAGVFAVKLGSSSGEAANAVPFVLSEDGLSVGVARNGSVAILRGQGWRERLTWRNRKGENLGAVGAPMGQGSFPSASLDGGQALVMGRPHGPTGYYWIEGAETKLVATEPGLSAYFVLSPDGRSFARTVALQGEGSRHDIGVAPIINDKTKPEMAGLEGRPGVEDWSDDGKNLLYTQISNGMQRELWLRPLDAPKGEPGTLVARTEGFVGGASLSSAADKIAYDQVLDGTREIRIRRVGAPPEQTGVRVAAGRHPRWTKNGTEIVFYRSGWLIAVPVESEGETLRVGAEENLFETSIKGGRRRFDVLADGERIVEVAGPEPEELDMEIQLWPNLSLPED